MSWGNEFPFADLAQRLIETRLRAERVRLAQRLQTLEARAEARGFETQGLRDLRKSLQHTSAPAPDRVDKALVLPRKPDGVWRRRYLSVRTRPGSVF